MDGSWISAHSCSLCGKRPSHEHTQGGFAVLWTASLPRFTPDVESLHRSSQSCLSLRPDICILKSWLMYWHWLSNCGWLWRKMSDDCERAPCCGRGPMMRLDLHFVRKTAIHSLDPRVWYSKTKDNLYTIFLLSQSAITWPQGTLPPC